MRGVRWIIAVGVLAALTLLGVYRTTLAAVEPRSDPEPRDYAGAWEHRFGDSPRDEATGKLAWAIPGGDGAEWKPAPPFGSPPGRAGQRFLWLRTKLVGDAMSEPALYLLGVDQIFEAYLDGERIYQWGSFEGPEALRFLGYKPHFLPLGAGYQGKTLALRVHSDHINIGIYGRPRIGSKAALAVAAFEEDLTALGMGLLLVLLGAAVLVLFALRREERAYLYYGGFALCIGVYILSQAQMRQILVDAPLAWVHAEIGCLTVTLGFLVAYMGQLFGRGPGGLMPHLLKVHIAYAIGATLLVTAGVVPVMRVLLPLQILIVVDVVYLTATAVIGAVRGDIEARILTTGFAIAGVVAVYDVFAALEVFGRTRLTFSHLGNAVFALSLGLILARRFVRVHRRLASYSTMLQLSLASARVLEPGQHAQVALDELVRLLNAKRAMLFLGRQGSEDLELAAGRDAGGALIADPSGVDRDIVEQVKARRRPLIARGKRGGTEAAPGPAMDERRRDPGSVMAAPLLMRGELLGVLYLERDAGRRPYGEDDLEILLGLGNQVAIALATTRSARLELQTALQERRILEQGELLDAAAGMASGDLDTPIAASEGSDLVKLARALEEMRQDVRAKIRTLEARNTEIQVLNEELRRQIEQRSRRLLETFLGQSARKPEDAKPLSKGSLLGEHYLVVKPLGEGAMGVVYEVERTTDGRRLAAKVMTGEAHNASLARFAREAQILARLRHPNLIGIFDVDVTAAGILYIVMELVTGTTLLRMRWRFGDLFWALPVLRQMAEALAIVHDRGIVHRDLKPANVLVAHGPPDQPPRVKLADFGISVLVEGDDKPTSGPGEPAPAADLSPISLAEADADAATVPVLRRASPAPAAPSPSTPSKPSRPSPAPSAPAPPRRAGGEVTETGVLVGTPMYMAPELSKGSRFARSPSDIFSLGVIAYELITAEMPFDTPPVLASVRGEALVVPGGLRAKGELDPALAALFEGCLSMDPAARPTAQHIVSVLASFGVEAPAA